MSDNDTLDTLDLSWNHFQWRGCCTIAEGLQVYTRDRAFCSSFFSCIVIYRVNTRPQSSIRTSPRDTTNVNITLKTGMIADSYILSYDSIANLSKMPGNRKNLQILIFFCEKKNK